MSEALFYANALEVSDKNPALINVNNRAAAELRRLHAENEALKADLTKQGYRQCAKGQRTTQYCGMVEQAVAAEREECAKVCEEIEMQGHALWDRTADPDAQGRATGAMDCAAAIRSRT